MSLALRATQLPPVRAREVASRIVRHALAGEDLELVLTWALPAIIHARHLGAYTDAFTLCETVASALEESELLHGEQVEQGQIALLVEQAHLCYLLGQLQKGEQLLAGCTPHRMTRVSKMLQGRWHLVMANYLGASADYTAAFVATQRAAQLYADTQDLYGMAESSISAGKIKMYLNQNQAGRLLLEEALARYQEIGDISNESLCLSLLAWCVVRLGDVHHAIAYLDRSLDIARLRGDVYGRAFTYAVLAGVWSHYYQHERVRAYADEALRLCQEIHIDSLLGAPLLFLSVLKWYEGDLSGADALCTEAISAARAARDGWSEGWAAQTLGRIAFDQGDLDRAEEWLLYAQRLRAVRHDVHGEVNDLAWLGRLQLARGRPTVALGYTTKAVGQIRVLAGEIYVWEAPDVWLSHAEVLAALGQRDAVHAALQEAYDTLQRFAAAIDDPSTRVGFLTHPTSARVINAWRDGTPLSR